MPFWQSSAPSNGDSSQANAPRKAQDHTELVKAAQTSLTKARRNLLGAAVLLLGAFLLIPLVLDKAPRAWGEDVILNMPKASSPYVKPKSAASSTVDPVPIDSTAPLKPSQPVQNETAAEAANPSTPAKTAP